MAHTASGIGLQNPAFFVGRAELLDWVNGLLNLRLTKVEQVRISPESLFLFFATNRRRGAARMVGCSLVPAARPTSTARPTLPPTTPALSTPPARHADYLHPRLTPDMPFLSRTKKVASGAVHCQILDACHPGVVNMSKVNFDAKSEYDMVNNYKQLQIVFDKLKISRNIEVGKLVKARPLDNLEFLQWMKHYYDTATGGVHPADYDGDVRRQQSKGASAVRRGPGAGVGAKKSATSGSAVTNARSAKHAVASGAARTAEVRRGAPGAPAAAELKALSAENAELKLAVERTEQEREFYFEKLQDIEFLCQRNEFANTALARVVEKILYFTEGKPDVDAIIRECAAGPSRERASSPMSSREGPAPLAVATEDARADETRGDEEEAVATPTFDEAAALGAALENECIDLTAPSASPLAENGAHLCAPASAPASATRAPLSPQPTNV